MSKRVIRVTTTKKTEEDIQRLQRILECDLTSAFRKAFSLLHVCVEAELEGGRVILEDGDGNQSRLNVCGGP